jgi:hypothetical protein
VTPSFAPGDRPRQSAGLCGEQEFDLDVPDLSPRLRRQDQRVAVSDLLLRDLLVGQFLRQARPPRTPGPPPLGPIRSFAAGDTFLMTSERSLARGVDP